MQRSMAVRAEPVADPAAAGGRLLDRYTPLHRLGRSARVDTSLALDDLGGGAVVVKSFAVPLSGSAAAPAWAGGVRSPYPYGVLTTVPATVGRDESGHVFIMRPYIDGVALDERLRRGPMSVPEALRTLRNVLHALAFAHEHGVLHGGVKPENVILDDPAGAAILVDFAQTTVPSGRDDELVPAARYLAPEQAGLLARPTDVRSDLYSVGLLVFECLTGRLPFTQTELGGVLREQLSQVAPRIRSLGVEAPRALEEIVRRLLHKDPEDRYGCAEAALNDTDAVIAAMDQGLAEPDVTVGADDSRSTLTEPSMAGREDELADLEARLRSGRGRELVLIQAEAGGGKSRLIDEFCHRAQARGCLVLRGYGVEGAAQGPLQVLSGVVDDLVAAARADTGLRARLADGLGVAAAPLSDVLPGLRDVLAPPDAAPALAEANARTRTVAALVRLLEALVPAAGRRVVLALDDGQWAGDLTLEVLATWAESDRDCAEPVASEHTLLAIVGMRPEELAARHPRFARRAVGHRLPLCPLTSADIDQVVESMAGPVPREARALVAELSKGNPFMVSAVLRGLVEAGVLERRASETWAFDNDPTAWRASEESAVVLTRRLQLLAPATRRVLDAGAVLGREFDLTLVATLAGQSRAEVADAVRQGLERHLLWSRGADTAVFTHDSLRAALLHELDPATERALHSSAAQAIEATDPTRAFELAYHFDRAERPDRALDYALGSGGLARRRHDLDLAERQLAIASRAASIADDSTRLDIARSLGEILMLRGRYDEAEAQLELAAALAREEVDRARVCGRLGELMFRRSDLTAAENQFAAGLGLLGERVPTRLRQLVVGILWEILRRFLTPAARRLRRTATDRDRLRAQLLTELQYPRWFGRRLEAFWVMLRQINAAERDASGADLARAHGVWGGALALTFPFLWRRALRHVERSERLARELSDLRGLGHAASMRGCVLLAAGRYRDAVAACADASRALRRHGDRWEAAYATHIQAVCLYRLGELRAAVEVAVEDRDLGPGRTTGFAQVAPLGLVARIAPGQIAPHHLRPALEGPMTDMELRCTAAQAEALRLRAAGRLDEAIACLTPVAAVVRRAWPPSVTIVPVLPLLATLLREQAERPTLAGSRIRLRVARRASRVAVAFACLYPSDRPHALREWGLVTALGGRPGLARRLLSYSLRSARRRGAAAEENATLRQLDRLDRVASGDFGETVGHEGLAMTFGHVERFGTLLDVGAALAAAGSRKEVSEAVRDASWALLRAEHCRVVLDVQEADPRELEVARHAIVRGRPILVGGNDRGDGPAAELSRLRPDARSALCTPILLRGKLVGWFIADHTLVGGLFGIEEERLAEFVARLAGAALARAALTNERQADIIDAQETERSRIARDLHDEVGQILTSTLLDMRLVENTGLGPDSREGLDRVRAGIGSALHAVQRLAFELRPAVLDDLGLVPAVRRLAQNIESTQGMPVQVEDVGLAEDPRVPAEIETTAYRIAQECLTNVARHASATHCSVVIARTRSLLRIVVEDDGVGFLPEQHTSHLGLQGMTERADLVGGRLLVESAPGSGTSVTFEVPVD